MGAWRPKHVEKVCSNKICILLRHVGVLFNLKLLQCSNTTLYHKTMCKWIIWPWRPTDSFIPNMTQWRSTSNHNYLYWWLPCQYFILLMMGTWCPKHAEKVCSNKTCILLHHVGVLFNLKLSQCSNMTLYHKTKCKWIIWPWRPTDSFIPNMTEWRSTSNHSYLYRWLPCQYFILLMMGAWRPKHAGKVCSNKICILLHHVGVLFNLILWCTETQN